MNKFRGWNGPVYVAQVSAPAGYAVTLGWDEGFMVQVRKLGDRVPVLERGQDDDPNGALADFAALVEACSGYRVGPFADHGAVDWDAEPGLAAALRKLSDSAALV